MIISQKTIINLAIVTGIAAVVIATWAFFNRPMTAPDWPASISGYAYSPFQNGQDPTKDIYPSDNEIRSDLALLSQQTHNIRTYSVKGTQANIPRLAQEFGMSVVQGIWISNIEADNDAEIARAIGVINNNRNITMVVVGNESGNPLSERMARKAKAWASSASPIQPNASTG